ncbi:hypothetical protein D3C84_467100 [compost metagenome]
MQRLNIELKMTVSNFSRHRMGMRLSNACWLMLPVGWAAFLMWQEWVYRAQLDTPPTAMTKPAPPPVRESLNTAAVAVVFGLKTDAPMQPSAEPLTLLASIVVRSGLSKALLANTQGARLYQVGDRLPGGSVLRRVEPNQVVLWNKGREELLMLASPGTRLLHRLASSSTPPSPAVPTHFLRPFSGQSE